MICSEAALAEPARTTGSCARPSRGGGGGGAAAACLCRSRHSPLTRRRTRCRPASPFRSSGRNSPPMGWCNLWPGNWGFSILGTLDDRVGDTYEPDGCAVQPAAASAGQTSAVDLPTKKPADCADQEARACAMSALLALGLGALLRTNGPRPLSTPSPIRAPTAISAASRAASIFCAGSLIAGQL